MMIRLIVLTAASLFAATVCAEDMPVFKLVAKDGKFTPSTIEAPAGKRFKIEIENQGTSAIEFESKPLRQEKVLAPGAKSFVVINGIKAGTYKFFDEYHETTGQGQIIVK